MVTVEGPKIAFKPLPRNGYKVFKKSVYAIYANICYIEQRIAYIYISANAAYYTGAERPHGSVLLFCGYTQNQYKKPRSGETAEP